MPFAGCVNASLLNQRAESVKSDTLHVHGVADQISRTGCRCRSDTGEIGLLRRTENGVARVGTDSPEISQFPRSSVSHAGLPRRKGIS